MIVVYVGEEKEKEKRKTLRLCLKLRQLLKKLDQNFNFVRLSIKKKLKNYIFLKKDLGTPSQTLTAEEDGGGVAALRSKVS
ncbi:MAG: hypothetical protein R3Y53_11425 [Bacillota bacterium]